MSNTWLAILHILLNTEINIVSRDDSLISDWKTKRKMIEITAKMNATKQFLIQHLIDITNNGGVIDAGVYLSSTKVYYELLRTMDKLKLNENKFMYLLKWIIDEGAKQVVVQKKQLAPVDEFVKVKELVDLNTNKNM